MEIKEYHSETGCDQYFVVTWDKEPPTKEVDEFKNLITAWFRVGMYGLFDGLIHFLDDVKTEGATTSWWVDIGSADYNKAVEALKVIINTFNEDIPVEDIPPHLQGWVRIKSLQIGEQ